MTDADLRAKIRELMASSVLPVDTPPIRRSAPTSTTGNTKSRILIGGPLHEPCTLCGESGPQIQCFYIAGQVVRVRATRSGSKSVAAKSLYRPSGPPASQG